MIKRPALRYHGGKFRLAPWILSFFPDHGTYLDSHGGGASILLLKKQVSAECYNDLDESIVNIFRVLRDPVESLELKRRIELTPFSRAEFNWSYTAPADRIDAAHKLIVRSFMGHGSDSMTRSCRTGFRAKLTEGRGLPSHEWGTWPDSIPAFTKRLRGVLLENRDALEVIPRMDTPRTLIYSDPPYVHSSRSSLVGRSSKTHGYKKEMTDKDHANLADVLRSAKGMVVLSGYPSTLYQRLYEGWEYYQRTSFADAAKKRTECVWLNEACSDALHSMNGSLFNRKK